ncbi:hypothetical protein SF23_00270 [Streptomyces sp. MBRL 10]|nr:hypothetical protein SF23_00270 [Streptomyces sp. MBRL 10]
MLCVLTGAKRTAAELTEELRCRTMAFVVVALCQQVDAWLVADLEVRPVAADLEPNGVRSGFPCLGEQAHHVTAVRGPDKLRRRPGDDRFEQ